MQTDEPKNATTSQISPLAESRIDRLFGGGRALISFEFFPPKDEAGAAQLMRAVDELRSLQPDFISITRTGGGTQPTLDLTVRVQNELGFCAMSHLTCAGHTAEQMGEILDCLWDAGIRNVLALRGDAPEGDYTWTQTEGGLRYSTELIELLGEHFDFSVGAAAFPEVHPEADSPEADIGFLKEKQDSGARFLITQLFFDNEFYFDFVARARDADVTIPIIPGIMPVTSVRSIKRITELCKSQIPEAFERELVQREDDEDAVQDLGVAYATLQCVDLLARGAPGIHFYTLNRSPATRAILAALRAAQPWTRA